MARVELSMRAAMRQVTLGVVVTGARPTALRTRAGVWLVQLGARVIGCDVEMMLKPEGTEHVHEEAALGRVVG